jgi:hypothetical protein
MESLHFRRHHEVVPAPQIYARFEFQRSPFDICQSDVACDRYKVHLHLGASKDFADAISRARGKRQYSG